VLAVRRQGIKTEPAFATVLGLSGDPYIAMVDLDERGDHSLISMLLALGFTTAATT
jgi:Domain of unknown function (DUF4269)